MPFPPFSIPFLGTGMTIGLNAVIHVLISHGIAIGVVGLVVLLQRYAHRPGMERWEEFSHRLVRFAAIVITTVGAATGVGIWFITSVLAPRTIGSMLRIFFWPWFIEWGVFVGELLVLLSFYYFWDHLRKHHKNRHAMLGTAYVTLAVTSAVLITGILAFMMTSGEWPSTGRFFPAFFNATFVPQLLLRLFGAFGLGALISLVYLYFTEQDSPFRQTLARLFGRVLLVTLIGTVISTIWYFDLVPLNFKTHVVSSVMPNAFPKDPRVFWAINLSALTVLLLFALTAQARRLAKFLAIPALILAIGFVSEFEYIREFIRGPYLTPGFMYANQVLVQEHPYLTEKGMLETSYWYQAKPQPAGQFLFEANCGSCHTLQGTNSVLRAVRGRSEDGIYVIIGHTHEMVPWMTPFSGNERERRMLANYLHTRANGLPAAGSLGDSVVKAKAPQGPPDLMLAKPLPQTWIDGLLFGSFSLHLLFVLFTVGTVVLGVYYFLRRRWYGRQEEPRWDYQILHRFTAVKSLAIVLGIAPLLLIQIGYTVSFFTAMNLLGSYWLLIIVLVIFASLAIDIIGQYKRLDPFVTFGLGMVGLTLLLAIPGIFVGVLALAENSTNWLPMLQTGKMSAGLSVHWLFRYLHVLGASIVFAGALHYYLTNRENERLRASLLRFVFGGLLFQIVIGVALYLSLTRRPDDLANASLLVGVAAAVFFAGMLYARQTLAVRSAFAVLAVILLGMLVTRQSLQWKGTVPVERAAAQTADQYRRDLAPYRQQALAAYRLDQQTVYDNASTIYAGSCAFCHGADGRGNVPAAKDLAIPPTDLTAMRVTRPYLRQLIVQGVPGTGMPYFSIYTTDKLERVIDDLDARYGVLGAPDPVTPPVSPAVKRQAREAYRQNCASCHGRDGRGLTPTPRQLAPSPPDFTRFTLQPDYLFSIITNGYPGTAMAGYAHLPLEERRGLVETVQEFYRP
ncbi:MAG: c-type cytochrome [Armatimonadota bacterium]